MVQGEKYCFGKRLKIFSRSTLTISVNEPSLIKAEAKWRKSVRLTGWSRQARQGGVSRDRGNKDKKKQEGETAEIQWSLHHSTVTKSQSMWGRTIYMCVKLLSVKQDALVRSEEAPWKRSSATESSFPHKSQENWRLEMNSLKSFRNQNNWRKYWVFFLTALKIFFFNVYLFLWERESVRGGGAESWGVGVDRGSQAGSALMAESLTRGSNSQTVRSWPEAKLNS